MVKHDIGSNVKCLTRGKSDMGYADAIGRLKEWMVLGQWRFLFVYIDCGSGNSSCRQGLC